jgi:hypothetical protein
MGRFPSRFRERQRDDALGRLDAQRLDARGILDFPVRLMIAFVPTPSAVNSTISARQTCFCSALRSCTTALSRRISADETERNLPARIAQTRTSSPHRESHPGLKC